MTHHSKPISPLRQRMLEDMALRKLAPKTQSNYLRAVINFTCFLGRSPDTATTEDLRRYQLHLVETGTSSIMLNSTITALRFFFSVTLDHAEVVAKMSSVREPHKLPVVLSCEEVARLIEAAGTPKYQAALTNHLPTIVDVSAIRVCASQRTQILHATAAIQYGSLVLIAAGVTPTSHLSSIVDAESTRVSASQRT